jgi:hypothetical protein
MKSRVSIILALLVIFSAGLADPLHATERESILPAQMDDSGTEQLSFAETGPGETGETLGDPDGWLGGQNYRPLPPITEGMEIDTTESPDWSLESLLFWFLMIIGMR